MDRLRPPTVGGESRVARIWNTHDVASPGPHVKVLWYAEVGEVRLTTTTLTMASAPETRMVIYTPTGEESRARLAHLAAHPSRHCFLPAHLHEPRPETATSAERVG